MRPSEFIRKFKESSFSKMVDDLNALFSNGITLFNNLSGEIVTFTIPSDGSEIRVPHRLKTVPKYRIILRQNAGLVLFDGQETWNDKYVTFRSSPSPSFSGGSVTIPEISQTIGNVSNGFLTPNGTQWNTFVSNGANTFNTTGIKLPERTISVESESAQESNVELTVTVLLMRS